MKNNLGFATPENMFGGYGEMEFIIGSMLNRIQTVTLVMVKAVKVTGVNPVGTVNVQPLVAQLDGDGNIHPHGIINNIPYFRLQGGSNAVIIDPKVGDIGMCGFCSRDISSVKNSKQPSAPQSYRKFDYADGLFFGGFLNGIPEQYIHFKESSIEVVAKEEILLRSPSIKLDGEVNITKNLEVEKDVSAGGNITDNKNDGGKSMSEMRQTYDTHNHNGGSPPTQKMS